MRAAFLVHARRYAPAWLSRPVASCLCSARHNAAPPKNDAAAAVIKDELEQGLLVALSQIVFFATFVPPRSYIMNPAAYYFAHGMESTMECRRETKPLRRQIPLVTFQASQEIERR
jgi:hypothetical protein